ncbi:cold-shock protein [Pedobacter lithocola]|uniref:Cold-shock protein n=1 Tax=Pedobacter lithocola TaxID=1908239 RepID=A0ABV8P7L2_9SPHI
MRNGIILSFNKSAGVGIIKDSNNQHIRFYADDSKKIPSVGETVSFEIVFRNKNLVASNLKVFKSEESNRNL